MGLFSLTEMLWFPVLSGIFFSNFIKNIIPYILFLLMFSSFLQEA